MNQTDADIARVVAKMRRAPEQLKRALVLEAVSRVVRRTPVDTGRARGNWQVTMSAPGDGYEWDRYDRSGTVALAQAQTVNAPIGVPVYIVNNLPYIERLEHGWSKQAPAGMVGITAVEIQPLADQIALRIQGSPA